MKISSPQNSMLTAPPIGSVCFPSASAEANKIPAIVMPGTKRYLFLALGLFATFRLLTIWTMTARAAGGDNFELAMVIKETTNPYYNATLSGARIAAGEIGAKVVTFDADSAPEGHAV
jgi:ABC-type sugar transport system substrate-binding protein